MLQKLFKLQEHKTNVKTEILAGLATFMTMAYILAVNPGTIANANMGASQELYNAVFLATAISSGIGTLLMAFLANKPFALAPGMGLNAYFATTVGFIMTKTALSYDDAFQGGLAIVLISGILFTILTLIKVREKIVAAIPKGIRFGITAGIGLMLVKVGLTSAVYGANGSISMIDFFTLGANDAHKAAEAAGANYGQLMAYIVAFFVGLLAIAVLHHKKVKGSILYGMILGSIVYFIGGSIAGEDVFASIKNASFMPNFGDMADKTFFKFHFGNLLDMGALAAVMTVITFCMCDMFDTIGTLLGTAGKAGMLDENGNMENMNKALLSDSVATCVGACTGTSTVTTFIESAAGIGEGGRTGLSSVVTGILFLACIFLAPVAAVIPAPATAAALVFVGVLMISSMKFVDYDDLAESVPVVLLVIFMILTSSIGNGIGIGLIAYSLIKILTGKIKDVSWLTVVLSILFIGKFFIMY